MTALIEELFPICRSIRATGCAGRWRSCGGVPKVKEARRKFDPPATHQIVAITEARHAVMNGVGDHWDNGASVRWITAL